MLSTINQINKCSILFGVVGLLLIVVISISFFKGEVPPDNALQAPVSSSKQYDFLPLMAENDRNFFLNINKQSVKVSSNGKWVGFRVYDSPTTPGLNAFALYLLQPQVGHHPRFHFFTNLEGDNFSFSPTGKYLASMDNNDAVIFNMSDDYPLEVFREKIMCKGDVCESSVPGEGITFKDRITPPVWRDDTTFVLNNGGELKLLDISGKVLKRIDSQVSAMVTGHKFRQQILPEFSQTKKYLVYMKSRRTVANSKYGESESATFVINDIDHNKKVILSRPYNFEKTKKVNLTVQEVELLREYASEQGTSDKINLPLQNVFNLTSQEFIQDFL